MSTRTIDPSTPVPSPHRSSNRGVLRIASGAILIVSMVITASIVSMFGIGAPPEVEAAAQSTMLCGPLPVEQSIAPQHLGAYTAHAPTRLVDTRIGLGGVVTPVGAGCTLVIDISTTSVPADAQALSLSVTALADNAGFLTVYPCADGRPNTSNLNTRPDRVPTPNLVVAQLDADRNVCIYSQFDADLIVDESGYWTADATDKFTPITPARAYDSRVDGQGFPVAAFAVVPIDVSSMAPAEATSVVANLTVTQAITPGYLVAWPCGVAPPDASNLNFQATQARAVSAIVGVGEQHKICVQTSASAHIVVDITGFYSPAPEWGPFPELLPEAGLRVGDSRDPSTPLPTKFSADQTFRLSPVTGLAGAANTTAVALNVAAVQPEAAGYLTIYPCDVPRPTASNLNFSEDDGGTNLTIVGLSAVGEVCIFASASVHVVVDLFATFQAAGRAPLAEFHTDKPTWPAFDPDGENYAVLCGSSNMLELTAVARQTTGVRVNGVAVYTDTLSVPVSTDSLTHVSVLTRDGTRDYYLRCMPDDFPVLDIERTGTPEPGWYMTTLDSGTAGFLAILDSYGAPVWYKRAQRNAINLVRRSDGRLLWAPDQNRFGSDVTKGYVVMSLSGTLVDIERTVRDPATPKVAFPTDHHDVGELPNGGRVLLTYPLLANQNLTALEKKFGGIATTPSGAPAHFTANDTIVDGVIQEISARDTLIWQWRASEHFNYDEVGFIDSRNNTYVNLPTGGEVDPWHLNAFQRYADGSGDYLVTARHLDGVFRVARATGKVKWTLSSIDQTIPNKDGAKRLRIVNDPLGGPLRPHDGRVRGDVVTMLDNRVGSGQPTRAVAYRVDEKVGTATMLWQITAPGGQTSFGLGSTQVLDGGGVLVDWGGPIQPMFQEFDADKSPVLTIGLAGAQSYRIYKLAPDVYSASTLRRNAGGTAEPPNWVTPGA